MVDALYRWAGSIGYSHPIHAVLTHIPVGLTIGAFFMTVLALATRNRWFLTSAHHAMIVAFVFLFIVVPAGFMDLRRFYGGAWIYEIKMKLVLAALFFVLALVTVAVGHRSQRKPLLMLFLYGLCVLNIGGLGFFGGQLVYRGYTPDAPKQFLVGRQVFEGNCSGCHPRGGNIVEPSLPLHAAPQLSRFSDFLAFLRDPRLPDGSVGPMPRFTADRLPNDESKQLYNYLRFSFVESRTPRGVRTGTLARETARANTGDNLREPARQVECSSQAH